MVSSPFEKYVVTFSAGHPVFVEGEAGTTLYVVQSGRVRLFRTIGGKARELAVLEKGDFFGESAVLDGLPYSVSAEVVEDAELIAVDPPTFERMIKANIEIAVRMLRQLSMRLREAERMLDSGPESRQPAPDRNRGGAPQQAERRGPRLESRDGGRVFCLVSADTTIGRFDPVSEYEPDIDLTDLDLKRTVSRQHARIARSDEAFHVNSMPGAMNGTRINGSPLAVDCAQLLQDGDIMEFGAVEVVFRT